MLAQLVEPVVEPFDEVPLLEQGFLRGVLARLGLDGGGAVLEAQEEGAGVFEVLGVPGGWGRSVSRKYGKEVSVGFV